MDAMHELKHVSQRARIEFRSNAYKRPKLRTRHRAILPRMLICRFQTMGMGKVANMMSVMIMTLLCVSHDSHFQRKSLYGAILLVGVTYTELKIPMFVNLFLEKQPLLAGRMVTSSWLQSDRMTK